MNNVEYICQNFKLMTRDQQKDILTCVYYEKPDSMSDFPIGENTALIVDMNKLNKKDLVRLKEFIELNLQS